MGKSNRKPLKDSHNCRENIFKITKHDRFGALPLTPSQGNLCPAFRTARRSVSTLHCCGLNSTQATFNSRLTATLSNRRISLKDWAPGACVTGVNSPPGPTYPPRLIISIFL
jgi:hypothetical protein